MNEKSSSGLKTWLLAKTPGGRELNELAVPGEGKVIALNEKEVGGYD